MTSPVKHAGGGMMGGRAAALLLLSLAALTLSGCGVELYANLPEREANAMIAALKRHGITASRVQQEDGRIAIHVDESRFAQSVQILERAGLPRRQFQSMGDVFKRDGLVVSPTQERAQMLYALSEELSQTVSEIDGVVSARVHVVLPDSDPLRRDAQPSSASVFIRHEPDLAVGPLVPQVKALVAGSVAQLSYDRVSVVTVPVRAAAQGSVRMGSVDVMGLSIPTSAATWLFGLMSLLVIGLGTLTTALLLRRRRGDPYKLASR
ncbi:MULTISPECIES: type III secretion system inner membrane ring lipoprotein SctJ [unclassified Sphingobium]|uniref:type III secretion system inner membrane ring lipoprotein SctJ n=1 Tax=unclassified Sphingobium TaxID=2611147 RepID=UPI0035A70B70